MEEKLIPNNPIDATFDEWNSSGEESNAENALKADHYSQLVHRVFVQTEAGKELLDKWKDDLLMTPVANSNSTQIEVGINEGVHRFIRNIITTCKSAETTNE